MTIEAMKQALEAMEYADACLKKQLTTKTKHEYAQDLLTDAGVALRQAIEQAEKPSEGGDCDSPSWCNQYGKCHRKVVGSPTLTNCIEQAEKQVCVACEGNPQGENIPCAVCGATPQPQPNVATNDTKQESVAKPQEKRHEWAWMPAPIKTQWGDDMVVADLAIDKDHTVSVYCERDQTEKVEAMFRGTNT